MKWLKAFIAGIVVPSIILPIILTYASYFEKNNLLTIPFLHFIPVLWGLWNMIYFAFLKNILPEDLNIRLLITGGLLGLLIAIYGVFGLPIPETLGLVGNFRYLPLIGVPILYAILWRYLVKDLNHIFYLNQ